VLEYIKLIAKEDNREVLVIDTIRTGQSGTANK
jgi:hypothetical protein